MDTQQNKPKKQFPLIRVALLSLVLLTVGGGFLCTQIFKAQQYSYILDSLSTNNKPGIFLSMYNISTFSQEDFTTYRGVPTLKLDYTLETADQINETLEVAFSSPSALTNVYLGLDPLQLWHSEENDIIRVQDSFEAGWLTYADAHPETTFEILLPFQSMDYWLSLKEDELQTSMILYQQVAEMLSARSNVIVYYAGGQEWLINNPGNYLNKYVTNEIVSQKVFLYTFCDHELQITAENSASMLQQTQTLIAASRIAPPAYPDLSNWEIVFFGDSIIGNSEGSFSVPGVINGLSGAITYNCAQGGTSAAEPSPGGRCFPSMAADFVSKTVSEPGSTYGQGIQDYMDADHRGKKLCFVVNFGLNDYFGGHSPENPENPYDISTYSGALRTGFQTLQEKYPNAVYILMGPGQVTYFEDGTERLSDAGGQLVDYYSLSISLAEELNIPYLDLYSDFPGTDSTLSDVLADGVHYNEYGRYLLGIKTINFLSDLLN